ncbi:MAG TPA: hypothetical protein PLV45_17645, partial [bacterium]|nr:hypothetical protein [bacterium]
MTIKTLIYNNHFRLIMSVLAAWLTLGHSPVDSFWSEGRQVVVSTADAYPDNPRAASLSRNRDRRLTGSFFHQTGIDVFLGYEMVNITDPDRNSLWLKMFVHNHTPGFQAQWTEPVPVSAGDPERCIDAFAIAAAYVQPKRFVCKMPAVYIAYVTSATGENLTSETELRIKQYICGYSDDRIRLTENPDFHVQILPRDPSSKITGTDICVFDIRGFYSDRTA